MNTRNVLRTAVLLAAITLRIAASSITTEYNQSPPNGGEGAMFDITVGTKAISITSLDFLDASTSALTLDVYINKSGTYLGSETTPAAWTLVSTTAVATGNGSSTPTAVNLTPFTLAAGSTEGIYITFTTASSPPNMLYTNGSNTYSNSDLTLSLGAGLTGLFGANPGTYLPQKTWDGTINYNVVSASAAPEPATWALFGLAAPAALFARRRYLRKY
jgi:hypothetical protein